VKSGGWLSEMLSIDPGYIREYGLILL